MRVGPAPPEGVRKAPQRGQAGHGTCAERRAAADACTGVTAGEASPSEAGMWLGCAGGHEEGDCGYSVLEHRCMCASVNPKESWIRGH